MPVYEQRTYTLHVGNMQKLVALYTEVAWPLFARRGYDRSLVGYFTVDVGTLNQLVHLWRFDDDSARRAFWAQLYADDEFMAFAQALRPLLLRQENTLLLPAGWGPQP